MDKIEKTLNIGRNKMIALALLCGCDYDEGVNRVGKEAVLKLFKIVDNKDILERLEYETLISCADIGNLICKLLFFVFSF